ERVELTLAILRRERDGWGGVSRPARRPASARRVRPRLRELLRRAGGRGQVGGRVLDYDVRFATIDTLSARVIRPRHRQCAARPQLRARERRSALVANTVVADARHEDLFLL